MREVVLDTETTGLDPASGHRIIEIGCVELINHVPTNETFHCYLNPERAVPMTAFQVHGLSDAFLADKPRFIEVVADFMAFLGESRLVIHNAAFDLGFLNAELARLDRTPLPLARAIDTITVARQKFPAAPVSLDALCRRFAIDLSERSKHGALTDARLLAGVYLELIGGREPPLVLVPRNERLRETKPRTRTPRLIEPTAAEAAAHLEFLRGLPAASLWFEAVAPIEATG